MAVTIKQTEELPDNYPAGVLGPGATGDIDAPTWQRIESYVSARWTPRAVTWIVEGCGEWVPPLQPATIETVEVWSRAEEWETISLTPSPLGGYHLPCTGPYRFTATVGDGVEDVPPAVLESFTRLSGYLSAKPSLAGFAGASSESVQAGVQVSYRRNPSWLAMAMQNSGAADLLRPYRKAG